MAEYDFANKLEISKGKVAETSTLTIKSMIPGCVTVVASTECQDRTGIDFIATLRGGAELFIDMKSREHGCSRFWKNNEPELALETYSVMETKNNKAKIGWTLNQASKTDYTLHVFDSRDCTDCWLLPFQLLRVAFRVNYHNWSQRFRIAQQDSGAWDSQCVFVPVSVVVEGINKQMKAVFQ